MDKFSHYCGVCGNQVLEDENECWVCADETNDKENYMINENEIDPTRLSVSDDGRTVFLNGEEFLEVHESHGCYSYEPDESRTPIADELRNLPYRIYCEEALRAHGSDFSYLRPDSPEPFPGRVMLWDISRVQIVLQTRRLWWHALDLESGEVCELPLKGFHPLPPPTQWRPMTPAEFVALCEKHDWKATSPEGTVHLVKSIYRDHFVIEPEWKFRVALIFDEVTDWTCGGQLLSVEE